MHHCRVPLLLQKARPYAEQQSCGHRRDGPERGSGRTTLPHAVISAAVAAGRRLLLIDTDSAGVLGTWHMRAEAAGLELALLRSATVESVGVVDCKIEQVYEADLADFIFIDTAGVGAESLRQIRHQGSAPTSCRAPGCHTCLVLSSILAGHSSPVEIGQHRPKACLPVGTDDAENCCERGAIHP